MENDALSRRAFLRAGTAGAAAAGAAGTAAAQEGTETDGESGGGGGATHTVDMTDGLVFDPAELKIEAGDTVVWETVGAAGHSVTAYENDIPEGADYFASGGFDAEDPARSGYPDQGDVAEGETYEHTFETLGTYEYFCVPHESAGMVGSIEVVEEIETPAPTGPAVPDGAKTLIVATTFAMVATLALGFFFLKFGGDSPNHAGE
jgi:plastocyanin